MSTARVASDDPSTADLQVDITDVCVMDCTFGPISLGLQVSNQGGADVDAGAEVSIYAEDVGTSRLLLTYTLPAIPAGTIGTGIEFELTPADVGVYGFRAVIDDDGTGSGAVSECDEANNEDAYSDVFCY